MATFQVKEIRVNGKKLKNVNGLQLKNLHYAGNTYELKNAVRLSVYTNNDNNDYAIWTLDNGAYVEVNNYQEYVSAGGNTIYAGTKNGYEFSRWDTPSFTITQDARIDAIWERTQTLLGSATIEFIWYKSTQELVCMKRIFNGEVTDCSVNVDETWRCPIDVGVNFAIDFYNSSGSYLGSETMSFFPTESDADIMYPSITFSYYG